MKTTIFTFILFFISFTSKGQDTIYPYLLLTNDKVYILNSQISDSVTVSYFKEKFGPASRTRKNKTMYNQIYDDLGIIIVYEPNTEIVSRIIFNFNPSSKDDPKKGFYGNIRIDNLILNNKDSRKSINEKLPEYQVQGTFGYFIYKRGDIQFQCIAPMDENDPIYSLSYDFKRMKD